MKTLDTFFSEKLNNNNLQTIAGGSGEVFSPIASWNECYEDTYGNGCDQYMQMTDDDGNEIYSHTVPVTCPDPA